MKKPVVAFDLDDICFDNAGGFIAYSNKHWGSHLTAEDYHEDLAGMWGVTHEEAERRAAEFHILGGVADYELIPGALQGVPKLAKYYDLVAVTSRRRTSQDITDKIVSRLWPGSFVAVEHSGIYDDGHHESHNRSKLDIYRQLNADYVADDQPKHCIPAAELGIKTVMFGNYPWNREVTVPETIKRCLNWDELLEYFDAERS